MAAPDDLLALNQALSQADRTRAAPDPGRVEIDGRSFADLLAFAAEYGRLITFYDLANTPDGDWSAFFASDPTVRLALRVSLSIEEIETSLEATLARLRRNGETREREAAAAAAVLHKLAHIHSDAVTGLGDFGDALAMLERGARSDMLAPPAQALRVTLGSKTAAEASRDKDPERVVALADQLDALGTALLTALAQDHGATLAAIQQSLDSNSHAPQSALYNSFALLFGHAQDMINRFPARLAHFYRAEVLRQTERAGTPDHVWLCCTPAEGVARADLPSGTRFAAGTDAAGDTIAYALDDALAVGEAAVSGLRTLRVTQSLCAPDLRLPAQVLVGDAALADAPPRIAAPFPLFGADQPGSTGALESVPATLGFALASPALLLAGGTRHLRIALTLTPSSRDAAWERCEQIGAAAGGMAPDDVFRTILSAAFAIRYSSDAGWVTLLGGYSAESIGRDSTRCALAFTLDPDAAPVAPLSPDIDPAQALLPDQSAPALVAALKQTPITLGGVPVYPYALLSLVELASVTIDVEVSGLSDVAAASPAGPLDTGQPFAPFGPQPVRLATLEVTSPELFVKPVTAFALDLAWYGLPVTAHGFKGYYQAYVVDADGKPIPPGDRYDNRSFRAALSVANPGWWTLAPPAADYYLFRTEPDGTNASPPDERRLCPTSRFAAPAEARTPPPYYDPAASAVRLTLTAPETAFGNLLYAPNVMDASVKLTAAAASCAQQCGKTNAEPPGDSLFAPLRRALERAPDATVEQDVAAATERAAAQLNREALDEIDRAITAGGGEAESLRATLAAALGDAAPAPSGWLRRLRPRRLDAAATNAAARGWLAAHRSAPAIDPEAIGRADLLLSAAGTLLTAAQGPAGRTAGTIRADTAARIADARATLASAERRGADDDCVQRCLARAGLPGFPNPPWMPMAAAIGIRYSATARIPNVRPGLSGEGSLYRLLPLGGVSAAMWDEGPVPLLAPVDAAGALYVDLSTPASTFDLLIQLAPPPGGWPVETPAVAWSGMQSDGSWTGLTLLADGTRGLRNSGIVRLTAPKGASEVACLRASVQHDPDLFPDLAAIATNAGAAHWVGPGGADTLGTPLPAGTITAPLDPDPAIGTVDQPLPSTGGAPALREGAFAGWIAERLRHKDRGIQSWDYASIILAAFPTLWQVAVVPARNGHGDPAPGDIWIAPVPGPHSAATLDPRMPSNDSQMLGDIAACLAARISPFVQLWVTDPPYLPLRVEAELAFCGTDTATGYSEQLNADLISWLSPWPPRQALGVRPKDYYTTRQIAHFIRSRPYVRAILALQVTAPDASARDESDLHYFTSAERHLITGKVQARAAPHTAPMLVRRTPVAAAADAP